MTRLRDFDDWVVDLTTRYDSKSRHESRFFIPSAENFDVLTSEVDVLKAELARTQSDDDDPIKVVLDRHFLECAETLLGRLEADRAFPNRFVERVSGKLNTLLYLDTRAEEIRWRYLETLLNAIPALLDACLVLAAEAGRLQRDLFVGSLHALTKTLRSAIPALSKVFTTPDDMLDGLKGRLERLAGQADALASILNLKPLRSPHRGLDYATTLRTIYGIDVADLLNWHRDEVEACAEALSAEGRRFDPDRSALQILEEDLGPYNDPGKIMPAMRGFMARAREITLEHMSLPEGEICDVWEVPEYLSDSYPWGGYFSGGKLLEGDLRGAVFLNVGNYRTLTRGWVLLNAVHECYPGHHAHFVKTAAADMPRSFKIAALTSPAAPFGEALCIRSETLMQDAFEPLFRLFVRYRRLHAAVRIWVDLVLHYFGEGENEAVRLYQRYLAFDEPVARSQVRAQLLTPGYFTTYYYGFRELARIEAESALGTQEFSELAFSSGQVSLRTFRSLLDLTEWRRGQLLNQFSSVGRSETN